MRVGFVRTLALFIFGFSAAAAQAQSITVPNFSFEAPVVNPEDIVSLVAPPWTLTSPALGGTGVFPNVSPGTVGFPDNAAGSQVAYIFTIYGTVLAQQLSTTFETGKQYTLTVGVGLAGAAPPAANPLEIALGYLDGSQFVPVASSNIFNIPAQGLLNNHLQDISVSTGVLGSETAVGMPIYIQMQSFGVGDGEFLVDNVRVSAVPEPGALLIICLGGSGLLLRRRRTIND